ncbi:amino acid permease, putative [Bodo saltans]|uniref:Amino acid permease, putative n=1 Tax=Bodo saltans TaxID=75058 RepID=A0A0S4IJF6_BODSA|nr:amino acid permease, putative [Bodo saltans]|eukprot:CUE83756.1 amino acid permease, putative [Bodo saltans]
MVRTAHATSPPPSNASLQPLSSNNMTVGSLNHHEGGPLSSTLTTAAGMRTAPSSVAGTSPGPHSALSPKSSTLLVPRYDGSPPPSADYDATEAKAPHPIVTTSSDEEERGDGGSETSEGGGSLIKKMTWYKMAFLCFVFTAGGPFGLEAVVQTGGPLLAILVTSGVVIFQVFPMVLIVTELSGMMPTNRGSVEWVDRAFGHEVGFVNSLLQAVIYMIDLPVYPVLVRGYIASMIHLEDEVVKYFVTLGVMFLAAIPAFLSPSDLGTFSLVCTVLIVSPFLVGISYGFKDMDPSAWGRVNDNPIDIATMVSVAIWLFNGFISLGSMAADVENPRVFLVGCGSAAVLDGVMYLLPLLVTLQVKGNWGAGFFSKAFDQVLPGLGWAVLVAGAISGSAMFASSLNCYARTVWGMADKKWLPHFLTKTGKRTGAPYAAMILYLCTTSVLIIFNFDFLVTLELIISAINSLLFYTSFIVLRYKEPEAFRPWKVPGGKFAIWTMVSPIIAIYFGLFFSGVVVWQYGIAMGGIAILLVLIYFVFVRKALQLEAEQLLLDEAKAALAAAVQHEVEVEAECHRCEDSTSVSVN